MSIRSLLVKLLVLVGMLSGCAAAQARNSCVNCHSTLQGPLKVAVDESASGVHSHKGMSCETCHGGDPLSDSRDQSHGKGFHGQISRNEIPALCGSCHADVNRIKGFNPSLRTDQLAQYHTSVHGMKFAKGDTQVAVCTDCHGVHDIRPASDPSSRVNPRNVSATCSRCHSDTERMKPYHVSTAQLADYGDSVHHEAMTVRGDLSAPTCSTCHGSHGAVPPGASSVANVCGTCHVMQAQFFAESAHKDVFGDGCVTCHSAHKIKHPDDQFVGLAKGSACSECHSADDDPGKTAVAIHEHLENYAAQIAQTAVLIDRAARSGMDVADTQMEVSQAMDALTKARVRVHAARLEKVDAELDAGSKIVARARNEAESALRERNSRRKGLLVPVVVIAAVVIALGAYIRELERNGNS